MFYRFHYSPTLELLLLVIRIKVSIRPLMLTIILGNRHQPCGCCIAREHARSPRRLIPLLVSTVRATIIMGHELTLVKFIVVISLM
jgi:hypothetical protein